MSHPEWRVALRAELAPLLASIARGEGGSPAERYRAEGFARALCTLHIAAAEDVVACIHEAYTETLGQAMSNYDTEDFVLYDGDETRPCVPVRLPRAPVFTGSSA